MNLTERGNEMEISNQLSDLLAPMQIDPAVQRKLKYLAMINKTAEVSGYIIAYAALWKVHTLLGAAFTVAWGIYEVTMYFGRATYEQAKNKAASDFFLKVNQNIGGGNA